MLWKNNFDRASVKNCQNKTESLVIKVYVASLM